MYTQLVQESTRKNYIEEIPAFEATDKGELWTCPFCTSQSTVYQLQLPNSQDTTRLEYVRKLIREHLEMHRKDVRSQMLGTSDAAYDRARQESIRRVRLWITGTINDRRLYEEEPI